jgi:uncharacterized protein (TIGR03435 family)
MAMKGSCWRADFSRSISLAVAAVVLLSGPISVLAQAAASSAGGDSKPLAFEIVSIREDKSESISQASGQNGPTADGLHLKGVTAFTLLQIAYSPSDGRMSFRPNRIMGVPAWAFYSNGIRYDIDAKVSEADLLKWRDPAQRPVMLPAMVQAMLSERLKLATHRETREIPVYDLMVGRKSPKFKPSEGATLEEIRMKYPHAQMLSGGTIAADGPEPGEQMFFGVTIPELCILLENLAGRPIRDKTDLEGKFDVAYRIEQRPPAQPDGTPTPVSDDFFNAQISSIVRELGLQVKAAKGPVEVLVVDHVEQPSEN